MQIQYRKDFNSGRFELSTTLSSPITEVYLKEDEAWGP